MKPLLLSILILSGLTASAQTFGIRLAGAKGYSAFSRESFRRNNSGNLQNLSIGGYYDQSINRRWGISTGVNYFRLKGLPFQNFEQLEVGYENLSVLEIPFYLSYQLAPRAGRRWELNLLAGYAYGKIIGVEQEVYDPRLYVAPKPAVHRRGSTAVPGYYFVNAGFEWTYHFANRQTVSIGLQQRYGRRNQDSDYAGPVRDYCLVLKTGIRTGRNKKDATQTGQ